MFHIRGVQCRAAALQLRPGRTLAHVFHLLTLNAFLLLHWLHSLPELLMHSRLPFCPFALLFVPRLTFVHASVCWQVLYLRQRCRQHFGLERAMGNVTKEP